MSQKAIPTTVACVLLGALAGAQVPATRVHRLVASPSTVAYGYYWADARPALRIASGDVIDVDTLLTSTPMALAQSGVPQDKIQESLKAIVAEVTGDRRARPHGLVEMPVDLRHFVELRDLEGPLGHDRLGLGWSDYCPERENGGQAGMHVDETQARQSFVPKTLDPWLVATVWRTTGPKRGTNGQGRMAR